MKLPYLTLFWCLSLATGLALADPCVKIRDGETERCMTFSPAQKRHAAQYGLQLAAPFKATKAALLKQAWVLDKRWLSDADGASADGKELSCGSGWDAVCQSAFRRGDVVLVLTLSGVNEGMPLVALEVEKGDPPAAGYARTLTTPSFIVRIEVNCPEGHVTCRHVGYRGTSRKTGKSIALSGKTQHSLCADRKTPCGFQGYEFWNGTTRYRVLEDGRLFVTQNDKVLLEERGSWH
ncbi:hypothetical protein [Massilia sp. Mn16-1_5]|uniref:hypothetical protein n=1 Tax=Massilia sp. Mn16-1_5 TaxID=2079199 RepID=UPI001E54F4CF|nr:hypothetical protein [Massilia sp. Mn16-1_5]